MTKTELLTLFKEKARATASVQDKARSDECAEGIGSTYKHGFAAGQGDAWREAAQLLRELGKGPNRTDTDMSVNLDMTSDRDGLTESGKMVPAGTTVRYVAHVVGGCVRVTLPEGGGTEIMNPNCFRQLR